MHKPVPVLENEIHKILWDFKVPTDYLMSSRKPDCLIISKKLKNCRLVDFALPADHRVKIKENEKRGKYLNLTRELKNAKKHESNGDSNNNWSACNSPQSLGKVMYFDLRPGQTCLSKDSRSDTSQWPLIERNRAGELG